MEAGRVFRFSDTNPTVAGCTISEQLKAAGDTSVFVFSLAKDTDISAERYDYHKLLLVDAGEMDIYTTGGKRWHVEVGDAFVTECGVDVGMTTDVGCIYTEINLRKDATMNEAIAAGEAFKLKDLLPYQENKIVNMDIESNDTMKFVLMSFDAGTGLAEHAAPGEALVFALDGEATITYEGVEHHVGAGDTFKFDKQGKHAVQALTPFKMALLVFLQ